MSDLLPESFSAIGDPPMVLALKDIHGDVDIVSGPVFSWEAGGGGQDEIAEERDGDIILLKGKRQSGSSSSINVSGNSISVSGGASVIQSNGSVVVNGVDVTEAVNGSSSRRQKKISLRITVPEQTAIVLGGVDSLTCRVKVGHVHLALEGAESCAVFEGRSASVTGSMSGRSRCRLNHVEGMVNVALTGQCALTVLNGSMPQFAVTATGQSDVDATGGFGQVNVTATGQCELKTWGRCEGNYVASSTGQSDITHGGGVMGQVIKSSTGQSDISVS